jgi:hypothetical protein
MNMDDAFSTCFFWKKYGIIGILPSNIDIGHNDI